MAEARRKITIAERKELVKYCISNNREVPELELENKRIKKYKEKWCA